MNDRKHGSLLARPLPASLVLLATIVLAAALPLAWVRAARDRASLVTDGARWIWYTLDIGEQRPIHFYASRRFHLDSVPRSAGARLFVDPRGALSVNGRRFPPVEQLPGSDLAVLEVAPALVEGENRVVIEAESPSGAGGILFCLDLPGGESLVSDSSWRVALSEHPAAGEDRAAKAWGRPPMYPWGYPKIQPSR